MLRFKLDVNFVHSLKFHLKYFPSLAILSHDNKTKNFKLTPNIPSKIDHCRKMKYSI